jgi:LPPG:FO 2-phospho-L-lactate transferase
MRGLRDEARPGSVFAHMRITVLCGGLGGSRLVDSLARAAGADAVTAVGNVGDDVEILGLHVSPDLDTILYTLANLLDEGRGWGVRDETYGALGLAGELGGETWFTLGDRDIGLHLVRTALLREGRPLSEVTTRLAASLRVATHILPATDDRLRTFVSTPEGELAFQEWFVRRGHRDPVRSVRYECVESVRPAPGVVEAIDEADLVFLAPSNPFVSLGPILAVRGIAEALARRTGPVVAVSPIVGGKALRGPLAEMLEAQGLEASAVGAARLVAEHADAFVLDEEDAGLMPEIEELGLRPLVAPIVMVEPGSREEVGRGLLDVLDREAARR